MNAPETREFGYFVAVAEERHFGRAAARLGIAQPALSRAVQRLERRLGVVLLQRTSRAVELTRAGAVFLDQSRVVLDAAEAAVRRTQRADGDSAQLAVATKPEGDAGLLEQVLPALRHREVAAQVEVVVCGVGEAARLLRAGRVDAAFLHPPHDNLTGLDGEPLLSQQQVAVMSRRHRLAGRETLVLADLHGETFPRWPGDPESPTAGPLVRDVGQLMPLVALDQLVAVVPDSVRRIARPDVVCIPVSDAPTAHVVLAWSPANHQSALAAFVRIVVEAARAVRDENRARVPRSWDRPTGWE